MADDTLRDQVAKAVCSIAIGSERVETVMDIIQEHTEAETQRLQDLVDELRKREASQDRIRRQLTQERDAWRDRANRAATQVARVRTVIADWSPRTRRKIDAALDGTEATDGAR